MMLGHVNVSFSRFPRDARDSLTLASNDHCAHASLQSSVALGTQIVNHHHAQISALIAA